MTAARIVATITQRILAQVFLPATSYPGAAYELDRKVAVTDFDLDAAHDDTTTPAPAAAIVATLTIGGGGTVTLDLTAAPIIGAESGGAPAATEDLTGDRIYALKLETPADNSGTVTVAAAASNGYLLFGTGGSLELPPGSHASLYSRSLPTIAAAAKDIEFAGTSADTVSIVALTETV